MIKVVKIETLYNVANFYSRINDKYYQAIFVLVDSMAIMFLYI